MKKYLQLYNQLREQIASGEFTPEMHLPTENEIASLHGISRQTVRQALDLLRRDGYIYSVQGSGTYVSAQTKDSPTNKRIAVITTYFSEYIFPSILRGISNAAVEKGYAMEISATNNSISTEKMILANILQHPVSGIIAEGTKSALPNPNTTFYRQLAEQRIPIVFFNSIYPDLNNEHIVSVVTDDFRGGYENASNLIAQGHKKIGCIFKSDDAQGINRFSGVISALADNSVDYDDSNFFWFSTETKYTLTATLSASNLFSNCTAVICYNDEIATMLFSYMKSNSHSIRSVASFDHNINQDLIPQGVTFSSLWHPKDALGRAAACKLFNMLAGKPESSSVLGWSEP